jgi:hypothetical protein
VTTAPTKQQQVVAVAIKSEVVEEEQPGPVVKSEAVKEEHHPEPVMMAIAIEGEVDVAVPQQSVAVKEEQQSRKEAVRKPPPKPRRGHGLILHEKEEGEWTGLSTNRVGDGKRPIKPTHNCDDTCVGCLSSKRPKTGDGASASDRLKPKSEKPAVAAAAAAAAAAPVVVKHEAASAALQSCIDSYHGNKNAQETRPPPPHCIPGYHLASAVQAVQPVVHAAVGVLAAAFVQHQQSGSGPAADDDDWLDDGSNDPTTWVMRDGANLWDGMPGPDGSD